MCTSDNEVFVHQLLPKKHGSPVLISEPYDDLPPEYRENGVSIGDVVIHTAEGSIDFLFNICVPADHPINSFNGVPDGFEPVLLARSEKSSITNMHKAGSVISSETLKQESVAAEGGLQENPFVLSFSTMYAT